MPAAWRQILLHVDASPGSIVRLEVALEVAARHDARVNAVFAAVSPQDESSYGYSAGAAYDGVATARRLEWRDRAQARLRRASSAEGSRVAWFDLAGDALVAGFIAEAAYADLMVLGPPFARSESGGTPSGFVEAVLVESGRPGLVVPSVAPSRAPGRRVLVAWDGSPQAARALTAALPLLAHAESVHVVSWSGHPPCAPCSGVPIEGYLARHGVGAEVHAHGPSAHVGDDLVALTRRLGVDLVVMGCYRHGRAREWALGGATRSMLQALPVPVLMAH